MHATEVRQTGFPEQGFGSFAPGFTWQSLSDDISGNRTDAEIWQENSRTSIPKQALSIKPPIHGLVTIRKRVRSVNPIPNPDPNPTQAPQMSLKEA
jgi:hypothetical protein